MEKVWLKSYPPGVPKEIDPTQYESVTAMLEESFREYRARPAFASGDPGSAFTTWLNVDSALSAWSSAA